MFWLAQKNRLIETVPLSNHNMFCLRNKKYNCHLHTLIWGPDIFRYLNYILCSSNFPLSLMQQSQDGLLYILMGHRLKFPNDIFLSISITKMNTYLDTCSILYE